MLGYKRYVTSLMILTISICTAVNPIHAKYKMFVVNPQDPDGKHHTSANSPNISKIYRHSESNRFYKRIYIPGELEWNEGRKISYPKIENHYRSDRINLQPQGSNIIYSSLIDPLENTSLFPRKKTVHKRRLLGNANPLERHLAKLKQVGADNKPHNFLLSKSALRTYGLGDEYIYIRNPVELGSPRAVMTINELKDIMSKSVLPKNRDNPVNFGRKKDINKPAMSKTNKRKRKNIRNVKSSNRLSNVKDKILPKIITNNATPRHYPVNFGKKKVAKGHVDQSAVKTVGRNDQPSDRSKMHKKQTTILPNVGITSGLNRPKLNVFNKTNLPRTNGNKNKSINTLITILPIAVSVLPEQTKVTVMKHGPKTTLGPDNLIDISSSAVTKTNSPITTFTEHTTTVEPTTESTSKRPLDIQPVLILPGQTKVNVMKYGPETTLGPDNLIDISSSAVTTTNSPTTTLTEDTTTVEPTTESTSKRPLDRPRVFFESSFEK